MEMIVKIPQTSTTDFKFVYKFEIFVISLIIKFWAANNIFQFCKVESFNEIVKFEDFISAFDK
jgi:hypothetical protein